MKKCPKCGHENPDDYAFCIKDGTDIRGIQLVPPFYNSTSTASTVGPVAGGNDQTFKLLGQNLCPANEELEVKSYHCTSFKSWLLSLNAEGYLVVTNKRVVFHAFGSSFAGKSILQSEVPIEDVSGISIYKGSYFSFMHFFGALLSSLFVGGVINGVLIGLVVGLGRQALQNDSLTNLDSLQSTANALQIALQVLLWILAIAGLAGSFFFSKQNILRSALAGISALAFTELGGVSYVSSALASFMNNNSGSPAGGLILIVALGVGIYALVCFFWFARRPTMSLAVGSKGGSSTPIAISGISSFGIYNTAASKALSAEPAEDVEALVKELGVLIMDIQAMGDLGIKQWQAS